MGRAFRFRDTVKDEAYERQKGRCACCGESIKDDLLYHAHHVVPNQSGRAGNPNHAWLATAANCVLLCEVCHYRVHENGRYVAGAVAPPEYYPFSHGRASRQHQEWVAGLHRLTRSVWR